MIGVIGLGITAYTIVSALVFWLAGRLAGPTDPGFGRTLTVAVACGLGSGSAMFLATTLLMPVGVVIGALIALVLSTLVVREALSVGLGRAGLVVGLHLVAMAALALAALMIAGWSFTRLVG